MAPQHQRADDPVIITTRDIYQLASETAGKVDTLIQVTAASGDGHRDHETRIRSLERRFYGLVGTLGVLAAVGYYLLDKALA